MPRFFQKLERRGVTRVAAAYLAVAWLAIEVLTTVSEPLGIPDWIVKATIISAILGFPIALTVSWVYRLTPEGHLELESATGARAPARLGGRKIDFVIIGALALAVVFLLVGRGSEGGSPGALESGERPVVTAIRKLTESPIYFPPYSSVFPIVVDDTRIYFNHFAEGQGKIGQISRTGGQMLDFNNPLSSEDIGSFIDRLSPDGTALVMNVFSKSDWNKSPEIWEVPVVGGSARKIGEGYQSAVSPDGTRMVFRRNWTELYLGNPDMTEARKIFSTDAVSLYWLRFSPDGKRVRFTVFIDNFAGSIWEYSLERDEAYPVLGDWDARYACCGSWTPDGKYYVFEAMRESHPQIWAIRDLDGDSQDPSTPFPLTSGIMDFKRPAISSDGRTIYAIGWQLRGELVEKALWDTGFHAAKGFESMSVEQVDYSSDGDWAAFVSYPDEDLWQKQLSANVATQLTFGPMRTANPKISPNGEMIAFEAWIPGQPRNIFTIPTTGGDAKLISNTEVHSWTASWSPDGMKLLFSEDSEASPMIYDFLTDSTEAYGGPAPIYGGTWAPDGSKVVGSSGQDLVVYDFDTGELKTLVQGAAFTGGRYWSGDSEHIYLVDSWTKYAHRSVYRLNISDGSIEKIQQLGGERITWGSDALWVGVTPEGTIMYLRNQSIQNIYALEWNPD